MVEVVKILDVVAITIDHPDKKLVKGQVGTIVEELAPNIFEVEFCNKLSETISMASIATNDLMKLHFKLQEVA